VITLGLRFPWELRHGPDQFLWVTERAAKRVLRIDPQSGERRVALTVDEAFEASGQDGLLGLALHPDLLQGREHDYVYLAYVYASGPGDGETPARRAKIVRYTYDAESATLRDRLDLLTDLPASGDHNSGRLVYGPDAHLYYTIGDQGNNQFDGKCAPNRAQALPSADELRRRDWSSYQGKVLRLVPDGSIPPDNPVLNGVRSHVFTYGHRNAQGLGFAPDGALYAIEHGPKTDDELNHIVAGKNYGWPHVAGYRDDHAYVYANWSASHPVPCAQLAYDNYVLPPSVPRQRESAWSHPDFMPPLLTLYTVDDSYPFAPPTDAGFQSSEWPTIAPSSLEAQPAEGRAGTSLWITSLKRGSLFRIELSADNQTVSSVSELFRTDNRYRDLALSPDRQTVYVATDSAGFTSGPSQGSDQKLDHRGAILAFRVAP
jgi:PQQ-dependent dehydrogenase (s-GDH family)